ncbi:MAG TPA: DUF4340 domain-containing protein [Lentimicrobium sp.]|nr:DUF4340 domain-containing protein [Lentimicrobium sp.]
MRKNRTLVLATIVLALMAAALIYTRSNTTLNPEISEFAVQDTATVMKIFMADKSDQKVLLEKNASGTWKLNSKFTALQENVNTLLQTFANIEVREPVAKAGRDNILKMMASKSTKVEIYQLRFRIHFGKLKLFPHEKLTKTYYVGDATMDNTGTYALMEGADTPVVIYMPGLRGFIASRFSTLESDWRVHTIFNKKLPDIDNIKVEFLDQPAESYKVVNVNNQSLKLIRLIDNSEVKGYDTLKLVSFVNAFRRMNYEALLNDMEPQRKDSIMNSAPKHIITLTAKDGSKQSVRTFVRLLPKPEVNVFDGSLITYDMDRMYGLVNEEDFVIIQFFVFDKILIPLSGFTGKEG